MLSVDKVEPDVVSRYELVNSILSRSFLLAATVDYRKTELGMGDIYEEIADDLQAIRDDMQSTGGIKVTFSGEGFVPVSDEDGDVETAYCTVENRVGTISDIYLLDPIDISYIGKAPESEDEDDDEDGSDLLVYDHGEGSRNNHLTTAPRGTSLYLEFLTGMSDGMDQYVGGIAVRSSEVRTYNIMDINRLKVGFIDDREVIAEPMIPPHELPDMIGEMSYRFAGVLRSTAFRRTRLSRQREWVEDTLAQINNEVRIDRYGAYLDPSVFYYIKPTPSGENGRIVACVSGPEGSSLAMQVEPIRLDTLELFGLCNGKRIFADRCMRDPRAGLYIVAAIKDGVLNTPHSEVDLVWIPVSSQDLGGAFYPKQD